MTSLLTEELVKLGVEVTLFATADSATGGVLNAVCPRGYAEDKDIDAKVWECLHIANCFEHAGEFDIIHNQFDFPPLVYSRLVATPVLTTIHGFSSPAILPAYKRYNGLCHYASISDADRSPDLDYIATVYHGIDIENFPYHPHASDYLVFFGRIHHDKGAREAIEISRSAGKRLVMAGIIQDKEYFKREIEPHIDGAHVAYVGSVGPEKRVEILGNACALLHPINFDEPFGLSVVEAMACGTPVIAFERGSMPEIITHGVDGFLVGGVDEAVSAVGAISDVDRRECRRTVEKRFSASRMAKEYREVYSRILRMRQGDGAK